MNRLLVFAAVVALSGSLFAADDKQVEVKKGDKAPAFSAVDQNGKPWKSGDHVGKKIVVVYFYPAAMTGGCTKQACGFRDDMTQLKDQGVEVVGVSGDEFPNLALFEKAESLNFTLLSDFDGKVADAFGVPTKKGGEIKRTVDGKEHTLKRGVTTARWTFVIDQDGKIAMKNTKVNAAGDSKAILDVVKQLKNK